MKQEVKLGQTDYTVLIAVRDSTTGLAKTGLVFNSAGIDVSYTRVETDNDVTNTAGAVANLASPALTDPHLDWGFLKVSDTEAPGLYRFDMADGVFAAGAWSSVVTFRCTGCDTVHLEFILVPVAPVTGVSSSVELATAMQADPTDYHVNLKEINDVATQLQMLMDATSTVAADGDLSAVVIDASVLSHIMTLGADTDKFKATTDSLQGQRDTLPAANSAKLATDMQADPTQYEVNLKEINDQATKLEQLMDLTTGINADADLTAVVVDKSVLSHIMTPAANTDTFNASTDSLEAQSIVVAAILALLDDARGEPGDAALPVNPDAMTKLDYVYKFLRNKIETTATKIHIYNDAGANKDHTSTISDDATTFTRGEFGAGE